MATEQHRLECLGWRVIEEGRQEDGRYYVLAKSCGHFIVGLGDTRAETYSAVCSMALKLTRGVLHY